MPYKDPIKKKEYMKKWRENNRELKNQIQKKYYQKNKEKIIEYNKQYNQKYKQNPEFKEQRKKWDKKYSNKDIGKKTRKKAYWKITGVKFTDKEFESIWKEYTTQTHCEFCYTEFEPGGMKKKCLDHDHQTGEFRFILCNRCNITRQSD